MHIDEDEEISLGQNLNSFVPDMHTMPREEMIRQKLNLPHPDIESKPINEFEKNEHISEDFPTLFPYGDADFNDFRVDDNFPFKITLNF